MQHSEKNNPTEVKDRLFTRFLNEHSRLSELHKEHYGQWPATPLERSGTLGKLVEFAARQNGFGNCSQVLINAIDTIIQPDVDDISNLAPLVIRDMIPIIRLFDWLDHYGPKKTE